MAAIADLSQLINTLTGGTGAKEQIFFYQDNRIGAGAGQAAVVGRFTSLWTYNMSPGGQGAAPGGTARNPVNTTAGTLNQTDPGGGRTKYLCGASIASNSAGVLTVY